MQATAAAVRSEDLGTAVEGALAGGRFELMQQRLRIGGRNITLVVPRDVDAVMQMYIDAGADGRAPHGCDCSVCRGSLDAADIWRGFQAICLGCHGMMGWASLSSHAYLVISLCRC